MKEVEKLHHLGHRQRLRKRFSDSPSSLAEYELLELLLFYVFSRKDTKPLSKKLLDRSDGSLRKLILMDLSDLQNVEGIGKSSLLLLALLREIFNRTLLEQIRESCSIMSIGQVLDYYKNMMEQLKKEQFRLMFLSNTNGLIAEELMHEGTVNSTAIYPREIIQKALNHGASAIILVHNHPGGNPRPSRRDLIMTRAVRDVAQRLEISLLDHLIIGKNSHYSMREAGII
ncbi:MAG: DNA repair protein RadC [Holosporaceae bacterium]|jgi:DNA repair protein RadC|nr:DNA repair protein RadC [Holosporaceae bacterium]